MKAIILAAGVGKRLGEMAHTLPKCLLRFGGRTLLERTLTSLSTVGVREAVIVIGHRKEQIMEAIGAAYHGVTVKYLINQEYTKGAIVSLWVAREEFTDDLLIMDSDVLFATELLARLVHSPHASCFLLDGTVTGSGEEQMLMTRGKRVLRIARHLTGEYDAVGESVGFLRVSRQDAPVLRRVLEECIAEGKDDIEHEEAYPEFLQRCEVGFERVDGLPWCEVDFPEDIARVEKEILPRLKNSWDSRF